MAETNNNELVLVTGGSGFVGVHCIIALLNAGYRVRSTVRSLSKEPEVRNMIKAGGADAGHRLSFAVADLTSDAGWAEAVTGCKYIHHVASPFPMGAPKHEDDLIIPAREGTLRVLRAAQKAGVKRVVVTSSVAAIAYGHLNTGQVFTEKDWSNVNAPISTYAKSKTLAERAAWDFVAREGNGMELATVNPVGIYGPALGKDLSTSVNLILMMLNGALPAVPKVSFGVVDVRDVADLHVLAMIKPGAAGQRFLATAGESVSFLEMSLILKQKFGRAARRAPTMEIPNWIVRLMSNFTSRLKDIKPELGKPKNLSNENAKRVLGYKFRTNEEAIISAAESLFKLGLVKK